MTITALLKFVLYAVVGAAFVAFEGWYAYTRLREWKTLSGWQRVLAIRDILAALAVLFFAAMIVIMVGLVALDG